MKKLKQKVKTAKKQALMCLAFGCLLIVAAGSVQVARADWQEPTEAPPGDNIPAPISKTGESQTKEGRLRLDPNYNPDNPPFSIDYPLEVAGDGGKFITGTADSMSVADTLYVDKDSHQVGIGTASPTAQLSVVNGTVMVGTNSQPITGQAVAAFSSDNYAISGAASLTEKAGVYGLSSNTGGYGVLGTSDNNYGVYGQSTDGYGIYGVTNNSGSYAAVFGENTSANSIGWAGYFDGNLGAGGDVVSSRFLPTSLRASLIPFTSGQETAAYDFGNWAAWPDAARIAFDGAYVWAGTSRPDTDDKNLFKIRASDGVVIESYKPGQGGYTEVIFDGTYLWLSSNNFFGGDVNIYRFNPTDGSASAVGGLSANIKDSLAVSSINGVSYIWATDKTANEVLKINAASLNVETFSLAATGASAPYRLAFDGEYVWVATQSNHIIRLWAEDPNDGGHPIITLDISASCSPENIFFDGVYIWCLQGSSGQLTRIWAEDPNDVQHPIGSFEPAVLNNEDMAFDGTYLWVVNSTNSKLYRYLAADPSQYDEFNLTFQPKRIVFDGTYLWITQADGVSDPILHKFYSGTGLGHTDLNTLVNLDPASAQAGNINITGSAEVGSDLTVGGDIDVTGNTWNGSDETVSVSGGTATCANGSYIKGINIVAGKLNNGSIICRGL